MEVARCPRAKVIAKRLLHQKPHGYGDMVFCVWMEDGNLLAKLTARQVVEN